MKSRLSRLQEEILEEFFSRQDGFVLTGGAALAGYHLGHRTTEDLDLCTASDLLEEGERSLREAVEQIGAALEPIQTSPTFRRRLVRRDEEAVVVDLVLDPTLRGGAQPEIHGKAAVEPPSEILADKLCTLLSRAEVRDLVDVMALEEAGQSLETALIRAAEQDAAMTPAQLAWVLSQLRIGEDAPIPGGRSASELADYLERLQERLAGMAIPGDEG